MNIFFFFNDTATTEIYTLSLHDALPILTGSHTVTLSGAPSNCSVSGGTSQTVNVATGQTATASFSINCVALTGNVTVSTTTSGSDQPSGYTVSVTGGGKIGRAHV